jgi:predicted kinase
MSISPQINQLLEWLPEPGNPLDWSRISEAFYWVRDLKDVPQDAVYHAEGDVWIHTRMVVEALIGLEGYQALPQEKQAILFFGAIMHDISKPSCTAISPVGKITSPGHSRKGQHLSRYLLYKGDPGPVSFLAREQIANLVRLHGLPLWFLEKPDPQLAVIKAAEVVDMQMLALLAEADVRGRICQDQQELLERVELFRLYCKEQGVWEGPYPFENGHARWMYCRNPGNGLLYVPFDDFRTEVLMMSGLPGVGKDHWIAENVRGLPVISLDEIRKELKILPTAKQGLVINTAKERAREYLRKANPFVWNATNLIPDFRKQLIDLFSEYKARVKVVYLEVPEKKLHVQNEAREDVVPRSVLERMIRKWQVPETWESPDVSFVVKDF